MKPQERSVCTTSTTQVVPPNWIAGDRRERTAFGDLAGGVACFDAVQDRSRTCALTVLIGDKGALSTEQVLEKQLPLVGDFLAGERLLDDSSSSLKMSLTQSRILQISEEPIVPIIKET